MTEKHDIDVEKRKLPDELTKQFTLTKKGRCACRTCGGEIKIGMARRQRVFRSIIGGPLYGDYAYEPVLYCPDCESLPQAAEKSIWR